MLEFMSLATNTEVWSKAMEKKGATEAVKEWIKNAANRSKLEAEISSCFITRKEAKQNRKRKSFRPLRGQWRP